MVRGMAQQTSESVQDMPMITSPKHIQMKTTYPDEKLTENEWYQHIYKLLTTPYEPTAIRKESVLDNKRRTLQARRVRTTYNTKAQAN